MDDKNYFLKLTSSSSLAPCFLARKVSKLIIALCFLVVVTNQFITINKIIIPATANVPYNKISNDIESILKLR